MARTARSERVPNKMRPKFDDIVALTDEFCQERLNEEYNRLVREATAALCRKRPSPLARGRIDIWACGIVLAVGWANFLGDRSQDPHLSSAEVCDWFGVKQSTAGNKSSVIRDALKMRRLDIDWCLPSRLDRHPLAWIVEVNGLVVDVRHMSREVQEIAFEKGFIPYIPGEE